MEVDCRLPHGVASGIGNHTAEYSCGADSGIVCKILHLTDCNYSDGESVLSLRMESSAHEVKECQCLQAVMRGELWFLAWIAGPVWILCTWHRLCSPWLVRSYLQRHGHLFSSILYCLQNHWSFVVQN
uniref:Uncharacterized protein n=1 Tax=Physcomitrium patens TaxID=3218 RepID=A0A2K1JRA3_PHYPA|nr:hypothetical protein PHYPA_016444 [Physcomitrium patens]